MDLDYFILGCLIFLAGFVLGWLNHAKIIFEKFINDHEAIIKLIDKVKKEKEKHTVVESHTEMEVDYKDGIFYLYNKSTGQFLAQGTSLADTLEIVSQRFPGQQFKGNIPKEQAEAWGVDKEIEQTK